jgi:prepilin-type N-terminal cleavage/methylation domain-containing protein
VVFNRKDRRVGFTLIELLVVVAIIGVLMTLSAAAIIKFLGTSPQSNTRIVLRSAWTEFNKKWTEVTDAAKGDRDAANRRPYQAALDTLAVNDPERMKVIWAKIRQKQAFPQTFAEALNGFTVGGVTVKPLPGYVAYLNKYGITAGNATPADYESGICLLMALRRNVSGGGQVSDDTFGVGKFVKDVTVQGATGPVPCLVDGWGKPLQFCRWPLGNAQADVGDPTDPQKLLTNATWITSQGASFQAGLHVVGTNSTGKLTPLIASSGPNLLSGLVLTNPGSATNWSADGTGNDADNIYSNNIR